LRSLHPSDELRPARRRLKRHLDLFSPLRDIQVQRLTVEKMLPAFPELQGYADALARRERKFVRRLGAQLQGVKTGKLRKRIRATAAAVNTLLATPALRREKRVVVVGTVDAAFQRVVECRHAIEPSDTATIHRLQVAFESSAIWSKPSARSSPRSRLGG